MSDISESTDLRYETPKFPNESSLSQHISIPKLLKFLLSIHFLPLYTYIMFLPVIFGDKTSEVQRRFRKFVSKPLHTVPLSKSLARGLSLRGAGSPGVLHGNRFTQVAGGIVMCYSIKMKQGQQRSQQRPEKFGRIHFTTR